MISTAAAPAVLEFVLFCACGFVFALMVLGSIPTTPTTPALSQAEPQMHLLDFGHESVSLDPPKPPGANLPGGDSSVWRWDERRTTPDERIALGSRVAVEAEWVLGTDNVWRTENLLKMPVSVSDDPRGSWAYGTWPTEPAKRAPVDDNTASVSARTVWGSMGENTTLEFSSDNGHRVVEGEYLLDGQPTGLTLRAVLDGGVVVYADGWCFAPRLDHKYKRPSVQEVLGVWNRSARGSNVQAVSWREGYTPAVSVDGSLYLMPAYIFRDRDGSRHPVCALDPALVRLHPAGKTEPAAASAS